MGGKRLKFPNIVVFCRLPHEFSLDATVFYHLEGAFDSKLRRKEKEDVSTLELLFFFF